MGAKKDETKCFAARSRNCEALKLKMSQCPGYEKCAFYKSRLENNKARRKARERIKKLPEEIQMCISDKYQKV